MPEMIVTEEQYARLKAFDLLMGEGAKNDPANAAQTTFNLHGTNPTLTSLGIFGAPGVDPNMYSTIVGAGGSFVRSLDMRSTRIEKIRMEIVAGVGDGSGTNPDNFCGDPLTPGAMTVCQQDFVFGKTFGMTPTIEGAEIGSRYTLADTDRRVRPGMSRNPFTPDVVNQATNQNSILWKALHELDIDWTRQHEHVVMKGNRTAAKSGAGSYRYFIKQPDGLDRWIKTGYTDVDSGEDCDALDSDVRNFGGNIDGTGTNGDDIVEQLSDMKAGTDMNLFEGMGYSPESTAFAYVMHPRMWRPITRVWPCSYLTVGCDGLVTASGERLNVNAESQRRMQDDMYRGRYLMIDGERIPVLFSWGMPITNVGTDQWNSSIFYFAPVLNGEETHYIEYFDMGNAEQNEFYNLTGMNDDTRVINNGLYRMERRMKGCLEYTLASKWRYLFTAPFAAARLDNINFYDRTRSQSPFPGESYYAAGGTTSRVTY